LNFDAAIMNFQPMEKNDFGNITPSTQNKTKKLKAIFTFLVISIFWLNATSNDSGSGKQKRKEPAKQETVVARDNNMIQIDSISGYSINVNGQLNSVQITRDAPAGKSPETGTRQKNNSNTIEVNGKSNPVNIKQSNNGGKVNIKQNGNGNRVNISQTNQNAVK